MNKADQYLAWLDGQIAAYEASSAGEYEVAHQIVVDSAESFPLGWRVEIKNNCVTIYCGIE